VIEKSAFKSGLRAILPLDMLRQQGKCLKNRDWLLVEGIISIDGIPDRFIECWHSLLFEVGIAVMGFPSVGKCSLISVRIAISVYRQQRMLRRKKEEEITILHIQNIQARAQSNLCETRLDFYSQVAYPTT